MNARQTFNDRESLFNDDGNSFDNSAAIKNSASLPPPRYGVEMIDRQIADMQDGDKPTLRAKALNPSQAESPPDNRGVEIQISIDAEMLENGQSINRVLYFRFLRKLFEQTGNTADFWLIDHVIAKNPVNPYSDDAETERQVRTALASGETTMRYVSDTKTVSAAITSLTSIRSTIAKDYLESIEALKNNTYAQDAVVDFYIAHINGLINFVNGILDMPVIVENLRRKFAGEEGVHFLGRVDKIDYRGKYGREHGALMEAGIESGLVIFGGNTFGGLGVLAGEGSWMSRISTTLSSVAGRFPILARIFKFCAPLAEATFGMAFFVDGISTAVMSIRALMVGTTRGEDGQIRRMSDDEQVVELAHAFGGLAMGCHGAKGIAKRAHNWVASIGDGPAAGVQEGVMGYHREVAQSSSMAEPQAARMPEYEANEKKSPAGASAPMGKVLGELPALKILTPETHPKVLLIGVSVEQFHALLGELSNSTETGRVIADRIDSGDVPLTLSTEPVLPRARGLANSKECHVVWGATIEDTAATVIHEGVHQMDPSFNTAPRSQIEATARVHEFEYNRSKGRPPGDVVEDIYRAVFDGLIDTGASEAQAVAVARQAAIDMMRTDPARYGVEPETSVKIKAPAKSSALNSDKDFEKRRVAFEKALKRDKSRNGKPRPDLLEEKMPPLDRSPIFYHTDADLSETLDELEGPQHSPSRTEATTIGSMEEVPEIREILPRLRADGYDYVVIKRDFGQIQVLKGVFSGNRTPDFIGLDPKGKKILVGDPTSSYQSEINLEFGTGKRQHFEKTVEHAEQLLQKLAKYPQLLGFKVYAADFARTSWQTMEPKFIGTVGK